jgi:hypothetical protein
LVKWLFKFAGDAKNFIEIGNIAEKHRSQHGFIIAAPVGKMVLGRYEPERTRLVRRVIDPRMTEEYLTVLGDKEALFIQEETERSVPFSSECFDG